MFPYSLKKNIFTFIDHLLEMSEDKIMSNITDKSSRLSSDLLRALTILPLMDKYMLIVLYIGGVVGSLLNILTLIQKKFVKNPCSMYFLSASITDLLVMNGVLMMDGLRYFNPSLFVSMYLIPMWCKLNKYFVFVLPCLSSTFITLACVDRFCTSSHSQQIRQLSQLKVSRLLIPLVTIIWIVFSFHVIVLYDVMIDPSTKTNQCRSPPDLFIFILIVDGYFFSMFNGLIVPLFLSIFGFFIYRNVQLSRRRTAPTPNVNRTGVTTTRIGHLNRQNLHLITMLLVQSSLTVFLNIPYMSIYLNSFYNNIPQDQLLVLVYLIFVYIGRWFWFLNYVKTFYLNSLSSKVFRTALKDQFIHLSHQSRARVMQWTGS